jgi:hypothetical protein
MEFQDGYTWPHFVISRSVLDDLEFDQDVMAIHLYRTSLGTWTKIKEGHVVEVRHEHDRIFLKLPSVVKCVDLDRHVTINQQGAPHFRNHLPRERAHIRNKIAEGKTTRTMTARTKSAIDTVVTIELSSSDSEQPSASRKHQSTSRKRRRRTSPVPEWSSSPSSYSSPSVTALPAQVTIKTEPSIVVMSQTEMSPIDITSSDDQPKKVWPRDYYAIDVVNCFVASGGKSKDDEVADVFRAYFDAPYVHSTFYKHKKRWAKSPQATKDIFLRAGRTSAGLWSCFMSMTRKGKMRATSSYSD